MAFLKKIISNADKVIINGDFWDGLFITFDDFLASPWQALFPLLKKKETIYIYGNHDKRERCDKRVNLFSDFQAESYSLPLKDKVLFITHGHTLELSFVKLIKWLKLWRFLLRLHCRLDHLLVNLLGQRYLYWSRKKYNKEIGFKAKNLLKDNEILVCGHTHLFQENPDKGFINLGCINYGLGQYLTVNNNGNLKFHNVRY